MISLRDHMFYNYITIGSFTYKKRILYYLKNLFELKNYYYYTQPCRECFYDWRKSRIHRNNLYCNKMKKKYLGFCLNL